MDSIQPHAILDRYLVGEFAAYLEYLGLDGGSRQGRRDTRFEPKLDGVLANTTTERIMLFLVHFGSVYGRQVSRGNDVYVRAVQKQLDRLEQRGVIRRRRVGKTVVYTLDDTYPYAQPLIDLARAAYEAMSPAERTATFGE